MAVPSFIVRVYIIFTVRAKIILTNKNVYLMYGDKTYPKFCDVTT